MCGTSRAANRHRGSPDEARSRVQAIYGSRTTLYRREIMGEITDEGENMAFSADKLRKLFDKPPMMHPYEINDSTIIVAIDPNGGASASDGPGSDTAIVSFCVSQGRVVVSIFISWGRPLWRSIVVPREGTRDACKTSSDLRTPRRNGSC